MKAYLYYVAIVDGDHVHLSAGPFTTRSEAFEHARKHYLDERQIVEQEIEVTL